MYSQRQAFGSRAILTVALLFARCLGSHGLGSGRRQFLQSQLSRCYPPTRPSLPRTWPTRRNLRLPTPLHHALPAVDPNSYIIGSDDVLSINVWKEPEISKTVPVRPDGMISLPLLGEIQARGLTPVQLEDNISDSLKKLMSDPQVTVIVTQVNSLSFNIMGQVMRPGYFPLTRPMTVLDAIALCGGFRDFAKQKKIYVLRKGPDGKEQRLKFNYKEVIKGKNMAQNIQLQPHDTVVVP